MLPDADIPYVYRSGSKLTKTRAGKAESIVEKWGSLAVSNVVDGYFSRTQADKNKTANSFQTIEGRLEYT